MIPKTTKAEDERTIVRFAKEFGTGWLQAVAKSTGDEEVLSAFYRFLTEHWVHLRGRNLTEFAVATVRARVDLTTRRGRG